LIRKTTQSVQKHRRDVFSERPKIMLRLCKSIGGWGSVHIAPQSADTLPLRGALCDTGENNGEEVVRCDGKGHGTIITRNWHPERWQRCILLQHYRRVINL